MRLNKLFIATSVVALTLAFASCEKEPKPEPNNNSTSDTTQVNENFTKQLIDGGFETYWFVDETPDGDLNDYSSSMLNTLNSLYGLQYSMPGLNAPITAFQENESHSGNYALKLVTGMLRIEEDALLIPGAIGSLESDFIDAFTSTNQIPITKPYTERPTSIKGYFKYHPEMGDSASVTVILYNTQKEEIAKARWIQKEEVTSWTAFEQPVEYFNNEQPAYISLVYSASAGYDFDDLLSCVGQEGSTLWLDDMELTF